MISSTDGSDAIVSPLGLFLLDICLRNLQV